MPVSVSRSLRLTAALGLGLSLVLTGCEADQDNASAAHSATSEWISENNSSTPASESADRSAEARDAEAAEASREAEASAQAARESEQAERAEQEKADREARAEQERKDRERAEQERAEATASREAEASAAAERRAEQAAAEKREREAAEKKAAAEAAEAKTAQQAAAQAPAIGAQAPAAPAAPAFSDGERGVVVSVTDGDTLRIRIGGVEERVRLLNIDTPETKHPSLGVQCLGPESTAALKKLVAPGQTVTLRYDKERRDRYGRVLAGVWAGDTFVNAEMARLGLGEPVIFQPNVRFYNDVNAAWQQAKAAGRGQFAAGLGCTPGTSSAPAPVQAAPKPAPAPQQFAAAPAPKPAPAAGGAGPVAGDTATKTCPASHPIKANDNSGIYHSPGQRDYSKTNARNCYASAAAAQAAGFRAAKR